MTDYRRDNQLSSSAISRLDDYITEFAEQVIKEARRLNPDDVITSRDIADAYSFINQAPQSYSAELRGSSLTASHAMRLPMIYSAFAGLLSAIAAAILIASPGLSLGSGQIATFVAAFAAYLAALLSFAWVALTWLRARRARSRAVRYAELGVRDSELAYYVAEAMHSTRSAKRSDGTFQTVRFIAQWARLEDRLRRLAQAALKMPEEIASDYPIGPLLEDLTRVGVFDRKRGEEFAQILDVRNRLAHGGRASEAETQVGLDYMDVLEEFLDDHIQFHTLPNGPVPHRD
jgi:ABC-type multidrug transport system fused ATPase/permease subunit